MCEWDSTARNQHWEQKYWTPKASLEPGSKKISPKSLVELKKILLQPLHDKLCIMKRLVKPLPKTGNCFEYLCKRFPHLSEAKLKVGIFVSPDIRKLMINASYR
jgi:hypothetical protein